MHVNGNNLGDPQDDVLVVRAKDGDQEAFSTLFLRHREEIYRCQIQIVHNDEVVKDLLHDTYLKAWRHLKSLNNPSRFKPWLLVIAKHLAFDWLRRNLRDRISPLEEHGSPSDPIDKNADPQVVIEKDYVLCVLAEMTPVLRTILILTTAGYSRAEIAQQLGYAEGTVTTYQAKARKQFQQLYVSLIDYIDETRKEK